MSDIIIDKAVISDFHDCKECLKGSLLAEKYFYDKNKTDNFITEGINNGEIYIARQERATVGFMRIVLNGAFSIFPFLRLITVKQDYRGKGIGSELLRYYVSIGFERASKIFLFVSDFNDKAKKLYDRFGFKEVGKIQDLYEIGITEFLMMKSKDQ